MSRKETRIPYSDTDGLAPAEMIFRKNVTWEDNPSALGQPISFIWGQRKREDTENTVAVLEGNCLNVEDTRSEAIAVQAIPGLIDTTVSHLTEGRIVEIPGNAVVRTFLYQQGVLAHIFLTEVQIPNENPLHFVTNVSRHAQSTEYGRHNQRDFKNLKDLSQAFKSRLYPSHAAKYKVIEPISDGLAVVNDTPYPCFTMPYMPYGELTVLTDDVMWANEQDKYLERFSYPTIALPMNEGQRKVRREHNRITRAALNKFIGQFKSVGDKTQARTNVQNLTEYQTLQSYWETVATGEMLVYLLSGRKIAREHIMNAGDWMAHFKPNEISLCLITVRGGYTEPMPEPNFLLALSRKEEPTSTLDPLTRQEKSLPDIQPFQEWISMRRMAELLLNAKNMIRPQTQEGRVFRS